MECIDFQRLAHIDFLNMEYIDFLNLVCFLMYAGCIAALVGIVVYAVVHTIKHGI